MANRVTGTKARAHLWATGSAVGLLLLGTALAGGPPTPGEVKKGAENAVGTVVNAVDQTAQDAEARLNLAKAKYEEMMRDMEAKARQKAEELRRATQQFLQQRTAALTEERQRRQREAQQALDAFRQRLSTGTTPAGASATAGTPGAVKSPLAGAKTPVGGVVTKTALGVLPTITQLDVAEGEPGDPILITGTGFDDTTEVYFRLSMTELRKADSVTWDSTHIATKVPEVTGLPNFNGILYVKRGTDQSALKEFRFKARQQVVLFDPRDVLESQVWRSQKDSCVLSEFIHISHGGLLVGGRGDDHLFTSFRLKNGWVVERVDIDLVYGPDNTGQAWGARVAEQRLNTDSPYLKIHSFYTPWYMMGLAGVVGFDVRIFIRGPEGMAYK